ncbi:MaoC family dehydratase [Actinotalea sp. M2MS4P-6]|uniref:MaoC family dehydratase n=1 Tax=Actinotalea sp. M2MS4P-6 TaxID=2983762 RepID=UPI0021E4194D|nr:MaoC family dehydratase [Actinotalea sp. M2MS4P-6]MCV2394733.1 MaoC family dehydratase [Actinotalea sp. M2MS4P-6]
MDYEQLAVGDCASFEKTISEADVYGFAGIVGDFNPAHVNQRYAEQTRFGTRIAHGMLSASLFSTVFGTSLPGEGAIYVSQSVRFTAPVFLGDTVKATVTVAEKLEKGRVRFECVATKQDGTVVVDGEAVLLPPRRPAA